MKGNDRAYWLADKIPSYGDYAKEAALVLRQQADEIERLREVAAAAKAIIDYADSKGWAIAVVERKPYDPPDGELSKRLRSAISKVPNAEITGG